MVVRLALDRILVLFVMRFLNLAMGCLNILMKQDIWIVNIVKNKTINRKVVTTTWIMYLFVTNIVKLKMIPVHCFEWVWKLAQPIAVENIER